MQYSAVVLMYQIEIGPFTIALNLRFNGSIASKLFLRFLNLRRLVILVIFLTIVMYCNVVICHRLCSITKSGILSHANCIWPLAHTS